MDDSHENELLERVAQQVQEAFPLGSVSEPQSEARTGNVYIRVRMGSDRVAVMITDTFLGDSSDLDSAWRALADLPQRLRQLRSGHILVIKEDGFSTEPL